MADTYTVRLSATLWEVLAPEGEYAIATYDHRNVAEDVAWLLNYARSIRRSTSPGPGPQRVDGLT